MEKEREPKSAKREQQRQIEPVHVHAFGMKGRGDQLESVQDVGEQDAEGDHGQPFAISFSRA